MVDLRNQNLGIHDHYDEYLEAWKGIIKYMGKDIKFPKDIVCVLFKQVYITPYETDNLDDK
jgi:hypothetical protein